MSMYEGRREREFWRSCCDGGGARDAREMPSSDAGGAAACKERDLVWIESVWLLPASLIAFLKMENCLSLRLVRDWSEKDIREFKKWLVECDFEIKVLLKSE